MFSSSSALTSSITASTSTRSTYKPNSGRLAAAAVTCPASTTSAATHPASTIPAATTTHLTAATATVFIATTSRKLYPLFLLLHRRLRPTHETLTTHCHAQTRTPCCRRQQMTVHHASLVELRYAAATDTETPTSAKPEFPHSNS